MYNIVAQYVIKVKTVPPGKRQSKGWVGGFFSLHFSRQPVAEVCIFF